MQKKKTILYVLLAIAIISIITTFIVLNYKKEDNNNNGENTNTENSTQNTIKNSPTPISNVNEMTNQDKSIFNSNFDIYFGENINGSQVKLLISSINYSNKHSLIRKVDLIINGKKSTNSSEIKTTSTYSVSFEYDNDGLICKAIVQENK